MIIGIIRCSKPLAVNKNKILMTILKKNLNNVQAENKQRYKESRNKTCKIFFKKKKTMNNNFSNVLEGFYRKRQAF